MTSIPPFVHPPWSPQLQLFIFPRIRDRDRVTMTQVEITSPHSFLASSASPILLSLLLFLLLLVLFAMHTTCSRSNSHSPSHLSHHTEDRDGSTPASASSSGPWLGGEREVRWSIKGKVRSMTKRPRSMSVSLAHVHLSHPRRMHTVHPNPPSSSSFSSASVHVLIKALTQNLYQERDRQID